MIKTAVMGYGTIGSGVAEILDQNKAEVAKSAGQEAKPEKEDTCSMCGNFCAVKNMNKIMDGEIVSIFDE